MLMTPLLSHMSADREGSGLGLPDLPLRPVVDLKIRDLAQHERH
jgi:hypothetical protein